MNFNVHTICDELKEMKVDERLLKELKAIAGDV